LEFQANSNIHMEDVANLLEDVVKHNAFVVKSAEYLAGIHKSLKGKENSPLFSESVYLC